jgi:hypothetical protein
MAVQLSIPYETLIALVEQLPNHEKVDLLQRLQQATFIHEQSIEEKMRLLKSAQLNVPVLEEPSVRRVDWYGDDGR